LPGWYDETVRALRLTRRRSPPSRGLNAAERHVLQLLASDLTVREIGRELVRSRHTVRTHVHSIYRKLGVIAGGGGRGRPAAQRTVTRVTFARTSHSHPSAI